MSVNQQSRLYDQPVALAIIGAGIANAVGITQASGPFSLWNTMVGIIILCILQAYKPAPSAHRPLNIAYAATWSFTLLTTCGILFEAILTVFRINPLPDNGFYPFNGHDIVFFAIWVLFFAFRLTLFNQPRRRVNNKKTSAVDQKPVAEHS